MKTLGPSNATRYMSAVETDKFISSLRLINPVLTVIDIDMLRLYHFTEGKGLIEVNRQTWTYTIMTMGGKETLMSGNVYIEVDEVACQHCQDKGCAACDEEIRDALSDMEYAVKKNVHHPDCACNRCRGFSTMSDQQ